MYQKRFVFCILLLLLISGKKVFGTVGDTVSIIPQPQQLKVKQGHFLLTHQMAIVASSNETLHTGNFLKQEVARLTGISLNVISQQNLLGKKGAIELKLDKTLDKLGDEGYALETGPNKVIIRSSSLPGLFYGIQTFCQLLPVSTESAVKSLSIPAVSIIDKPRLPWRGLMLDVGRYYFPVDYIKSLLDNMARHKLNTFHWHLTEDHGWRMESKNFPVLTAKGAYRAGTQFNHGTRNVVDSTPHWGYYTQDQIKEVVRYAAERYITVVPEIEMPGHSLSALVAYPELSCTGGPFTIPVNWGIQKDIYCAGNDRTFEFLEKLLTEVTELFPGKVVHIGGDEAPKDRWKACAKCQKRIRDLGLKDEHELQSYFIKRIAAFLKSKGKRLMGWDEILEGGLAPDAMVMSWRGTAGGITAASAKHEVVMTPNTYLYLDYYQGNPEHEPVSYKGMVTLEKVYGYEPVPATLSVENRRYIKGVQGNIWGEYIHTPEKASYMAFPRAAALAEIAWTDPEKKNWKKFMGKMNKQYRRYEKWGLGYSKSAFQVTATADVDSVNQQAVIKLETQVSPSEIRYTADGTAPGPASLLYTTPFKIKIPVNIRAASFRDGKQISPVMMRTVATSHSKSK